MNPLSAEHVAKQRAVAAVLALRPAWSRGRLEGLTAERLGEIRDALLAEWDDRVAALKAID